MRESRRVEQTKARRGLWSFIRAEVALFFGLATAAFFFISGTPFLENIKEPASLTLVFLWLLGAVLWSAISVVRHADYLAVKFGEPYGTLILTVSAISIEVVMVAAAMLHGANNPTLARDMMFAVLMIGLNGLIGFSLLLGGLRHMEQTYNLQGASAYLNTIMALSVLGLVMPNFTTSLTGPRFTVVQEVFLGTMALGLYGVFLLLQITRHKGHFEEPEEVETHSIDHGPMHSTGYHVAMLLIYLIVVIGLAEKFAIPLDNAIERFGMPQAFGGAIVAALVLAPEALSAINAARKNQLQRSVNILHGSVLASIGLTIPAVIAISVISAREVTLGLQGGNLPLLVLTLGTSVVTFMSGRTNVLQGCIHLLLFAVFLLLIFCP
ncbi:MAG TPA: hypothetical protein VGM62_09410 [Chthoniobacterales bacterium]|jgi:Ca2+:H+ antiporter